MVLGCVKDVLIMYTVFLISFMCFILPVVPGLDQMERRIRNIYIYLLLLLLLLIGSGELNPHSLTPHLSPQPQLGCERYERFKLCFYEWRKQAAFCEWESSPPQGWVGVDGSPQKLG